MKLSISNIGWNAENDVIIYDIMQKTGYSGLEIAPTRIIPENPYDNICLAKEFCSSIREKYGFSIPSMQSIWYGRQEKLFGSVEERLFLIEYTKKAIDFAASIDCGNLVFGCPRNRCIPENSDLRRIEEIEVQFFKELGEYANMNGTVLSIEANPPIYNTNYINYTLSAIDLVKMVDSAGFLLNLDIGTMIENQEGYESLIGNVRFINHVHVSEPRLKMIENRQIHMDVYNLLKDEKYDKFVSIEVGKQDDIALLEHAMSYVKEVFCR